MPWEQNIDGEPWKWLTANRAVKHGDPLFEMRTTVPIKSAESPMRLPVVIAVSNRGEVMDVINVLEMIDQQVSITFEIVETGRLRSAPDLRPTPVEDVEPRISPSESPSDDATTG